MLRDEVGRRWGQTDWIGFCLLSPVRICLATLKHTWSLGISIWLQPDLDWTLVATIHFSPFTPQIFAFSCATRTPNSHNHSYIHYSLSSIHNEMFTNHSNHIHIFTLVTQIVVTMVQTLVGFWPTCTESGWKLLDPPPPHRPKYWKTSSRLKLSISIENYNLAWTFQSWP